MKFKEYISYYISTGLPSLIISWKPSGTVQPSNLGTPNESTVRISGHTTYFMLAEVGFSIKIRRSGTVH